MMRIPVIFFHSGGQAYLKTAIAAAKRKNTVILIGNERNKSFCDSWHNGQLYESGLFEEFKRSYKHMSSNDEKFELVCFQRYFYLYEFMKRHNLDRAVMVDSDVLVFEDLDQYFKNHPCGCALSIPKKQEPFGWTAGPQCCCFTIDCLYSFIKYVCDMYRSHEMILQKKYEYMTAGNLWGGVCDMTLLYLWSRGRTDVLNLAAARENKTFDHSLQSASNYYSNEFTYRRILRMKKIVYINELPFFEDNCGRKIQAATLHCQGSCKSVMRYLLKESNSVVIFCARYWEFLKRLPSRIKRKTIMIRQHTGKGKS